MEDGSQNGSDQNVKFERRFKHGTDTVIGEFLRMGDARLTSPVDYPNMRG